MASADVQAPPPEPAAALPDYVTDPDAVSRDTGVRWRYGRAPDYSKTRKVWAESKVMNHEALSLPQLVENLVKNWEVEASFKISLDDWRTIDRANYSFAINGSPAQTGEQMLKVGTYNAIIAPNEYYSPVNSDFASSHKTFKRMMPTFAWEVLEVYSGPPQVAFRWRHWGTMKNDYVGFNDKAEKVTAKAHGGQIDIQGVTVATVDDKLRLQKVETWFDPLEMFRQIAPNGIVNKAPIDRNLSESEEKSTETAPKAEEVAHRAEPQHSKEPEDKQSGEQTHIESPSNIKTEDLTDELGCEPEKLQDATSGNSESLSTTLASCTIDGETGSPTKASLPDAASDSPYNSGVTGDISRGRTDQHGSSTDIHEVPADQIHPHPKDVEDAVQPVPGSAVAAAADSEETKQTYEEMSRVTPMECPFLFNRE